MAQLKLHAGPDGVSLAVYVVPRAGRNAIAGVHGEALKVQITAPPVEGRANAALQAFLAQTLAVRPHQVEIVSGHSGRRKLVRITGLTGEEIEERLL